MTAIRKAEARHVAGQRKTPPLKRTSRARPRKTKSTRAASSERKNYWSRRVTEHSDAMDLEAGVFTKSPKEIAKSVKRSAERSTRRKGTPFRSAMSMLTFYENRAGAKLSDARRRAIHQAKDELRVLFKRPT